MEDELEELEEELLDELLEEELERDELLDVGVMPLISSRRRLKRTAA
jgi:hypothetical protein